MTILLLIPSEWLPGRRPPLLEQLRASLPATWTARSSAVLCPLDVRVVLANALTVRGVPAIVMEAEEPKSPLVLTQKFHELVEKHRVDEFYLYRPFGAARSGLDVEIGFLLEKMGGEKPKLPADRVTIFYKDDGEERRAAEVRFGLGGRLEFVALEASRRTKYYVDLVRFGATAVGWRDHVELIDRALARSAATQ